MRIAQIAPLCESVPPRLYGGTERVISHLCEELVIRGHDVTLFASADSRTSARLVPCRNIAIRLDPEISWELPVHLAMLAEVRDRAEEFDVLHFHTDCYHLPLFDAIAERTLTTLHGRLDVRDLAPLYLRYPRYPVVSVSDTQRAPLPFLRWMATVHHGYPRGAYAFSPEPTDGYLAFLGRIAPEKGLDRAIEIAQRAGLTLRIAAKVDRADREYFDWRIKPLLRSPGVDYIGEIGEAEKSAFLGGAVALLMPISWPEPFGLVMIEAMACGTPVIAFACGSAPEIVEHGVTGFVVPDVETAVAAVAEVHRIDRTFVRQAFERRFSVEVMTEKYEAIYCRDLGKRPDGRFRDQDAMTAERAA